MSFLDRPGAFLSFSERHPPSNLSSSFPSNLPSTPPLACSQVRLVVPGVSHAISLRKDTDGRLGVGIQTTASPTALHGAEISDVVPASAAHNAGLRPGDAVLSVDGQRPSTPATPRLAC